MRINASHLNHSTVVIVLRSIMLFLIMTFIIFSNIINIHILRKSQVQIFSRLLLISISVAGLVNGIFVCIPGFISSVVDGWPLGEIYCQVSSILNGSSCAVTIWSLAAISLDRYIAINHSIFYRNSNKFHSAMFTIAMFWILGICTFCFPLISRADFYYFHDNLLMCTLIRHSNTFTIISTIFVYIISGLILTVSSLRTLKILTRIKAKSKKRMKKSRNTKAVRILLLSGMCFYISWGPFIIADVLISFKIIEHIPDDMDFIITWLANSNSFMTVLVYSGNSKEFRYRMAQYLRKCFVKNPSQATGTSRTSS